VTSNLKEKAEAVRSAYFDGESYATLAERYNVPLNTMRTWLRRSLIKLRHVEKKILDFLHNNEPARWEELSVEENEPAESSTAKA